MSHYTPPTLIKLNVLLLFFHTVDFWGDTDTIPTENPGEREEASGAERGCENTRGECRAV